jgi:hypothetical protein
VGSPVTTGSWIVCSNALQDSSLRYRILVNAVLDRSFGPKVSLIVDAWTVVRSDQRIFSNVEQS